MLTMSCPASPRKTLVALGAILFLASCAPALAQTQAAPFVPPPRSIADITAILDQEKPDPKLLAKLRRAADASSPSGGSRPALAKFYYDRGQARVNLGRNHEALTDAQKAVEYGEGQVDFTELSRLRQLVGTLHYRAGDPKKALQVFLGMARGGETQGVKGVLFISYRMIGYSLIAMGDVSQAETYVRKAQALLQESRSWPPEAQRYRTGWEGNVEDARARLYEARGQFREAEASYRRAEALFREWTVKSVGLRGAPPPSQLEAGADLELALQGRAKSRQGRLAEGEADVRRALLNRLKAHGKYNTLSAALVIILADLLVEQGRHAEAEKLIRTGLEIYGSLGLGEDSHIRTQALDGLASVLNLQGRWPEAAQVYATLDAATRSWEPARREALRLNIGHIFTLYNTNNIDAGIAAAERLLARQRSLLGDQNPETGATRGLLAIGLARASRDAEAVREFRLAIPVLTSASRETDTDDPIGAAAREQRAQFVIEAYIALLARASAPAMEKAAIETFRLAEVVRGRSVQRALAASSARSVARDPALAELVRKAQDLEKQMGAQLGVLNNALALPSEERDDKAVRALQAEIDRLRTARNAAKQEIARRFRDYASLVDPSPPTVEDVRAVLKPSEAFVSFYFGREASFVWAVPQTGPVAFATIRTDAGQLEAKVKQLRDQLEAKAATIDDIPPFDMALAHELYEQLLKPVEHAWGPAKSLIVVTNGALGYLPLSLLPTRLETVKADGDLLFGNYRGVPWLARSHAVTMVPSASALRTLRQLPSGSDKREKLIAFGDPYFSAAQAAEASQGAASDAPAQVALATGRGLRFPRRAAAQTTGVDSADLALLPRLPDTADELRSVARALAAEPAKVLNLGRDANERKVKGSDLSRYRIVAFATHGLVPGDLNGLTQPALALTAPNVAGIDGDGLLTMEEVLALKLDADWVVLSACNTGAGAGAGAEAVSGLGRAFFYAGTRTLLVTNWSVYSSPATDLVTDLFRRQAAGPKLSRAEALRQAMMTLMDGAGFIGQDGKPLFSYAHPVFWAPYTIIGDGG